MWDRSSSYVVLQSATLLSQWGVADWPVWRVGTGTNEQYKEYV